MPSIKFSHRYGKLDSLGTIPCARLLEVLNVRLENLSQPFLAYDTDNGTYALPKKGDFLLLICDGDNGIFTTLRRRTPEKERYYRSFIGQMFDVLLP